MSDALATTDSPSSVAACSSGTTRLCPIRCVGARTASDIARLIGACTTRKW